MIQRDVSYASAKLLTILGVGFLQAIVCGGVFALSPSMGGWLGLLLIAFDFALYSSWTHGFLWLSDDETSEEFLRRFPPRAEPSFADDGSVFIRYPISSMFYESWVFQRISPAAQAIFIRERSAEERRTADLARSIRPVGPVVGVFGGAPITVEILVDGVIYEIDGPPEPEPRTPTTVDEMMARALVEQADRARLDLDRPQPITFHGMRYRATDRRLGESLDS